MTSHLNLMPHDGSKTYEVRVHRSKILHWLAPFEEAIDQIADGPDNRSFWERVHDADTGRSENSTIWYSNYDEHRPSVEIGWGVQVTDWGLGVEIDQQRASTQWEGRINLTVRFGPLVAWFSYVTPKLGQRRSLH